jgi:hypothetical protein
MAKRKMQKPLTMAERAKIEEKNAQVAGAEPYVIVRDGSAEAKALEKLRRKKRRQE